MISNYDVSNLDSILAGEGDWFSASLLRFLDKVLFKADRENWRKLFLAYPEACRVIYRKYGWSEESISEYVIRMLGEGY